MLARITSSASVCLWNAGGDIFALLLGRHTAGFFRHLKKTFSFSKYDVRSWCFLMFSNSWVCFKSFYWHLNRSFNYFVVTLLIALHHPAVILSTDLSLNLKTKKVMLLPGGNIFHLVTAGDWQRGSSTQGHLEFNLLNLFMPLGGTMCLASHRFVKTYLDI